VTAYGTVEPRVGFCRPQGGASFSRVFDADVDRRATARLCAVKQNRTDRRYRNPARCQTVIHVCFLWPSKPAVAIGTRVRRSCCVSSRISSFLPTMPFFRRTVVAIGVRALLRRNRCQSTERFVFLGQASSMLMPRRERPNPLWVSRI